MLEITVLERAARKGTSCDRRYMPVSRAEKGDVRVCMRWKAFHSRASNTSQPEVIPLTD